jgi:hypothetical protein
MADLTLDHVGIAGRALQPLIAAWTAEGFAPTTPRALMGTDPITGRPVDLGQRSAHVVFEDNYIELTEVPDATTGNHLEPWLSVAGGLRIIALGTSDIAATHRDMSARLPGLSPVKLATRAIEYGSRHGKARFEWFMLPAALTPEALVCVVQNHTPELVFQQDVMRHSTACQGLLGVEILCATPGDAAEAAGRYGRWLDRDPVNHVDGKRVRLADGWIDFVPHPDSPPPGGISAHGIYLAGIQGERRVPIGPADCCVDVIWVSDQERAKV